MRVSKPEKLLSDEELQKLMDQDLDQVLEPPSVTYLKDWYVVRKEVSVHNQATFGPFWIAIKGFVIDFKGELIKQDVLRFVELDY